MQAKQYRLAEVEVILQLIDIAGVLDHSWSRGYSLGI